MCLDFLSVRSTCHRSIVVALWAWCVLLGASGNPNVIRALHPPRSVGASLSKTCFSFPPPKKLFSFRKPTDDVLCSPSEPQPLSLQCASLTHCPVGLIFCAGWRGFGGVLQDVHACVQPLHELHEEHWRPDRLWTKVLRNSLRSNPAVDVERLEHR